MPLFLKKIAYQRVPFVYMQTNNEGLIVRINESKKYLAKVKKLLRAKNLDSRRVSWYLYHAVELQAGRTFYHPLRKALTRRYESG